MDNESIKLLSQIVIPELGKTLYMVTISTIFSILFGFILAIILIITYKEGLKPNKAIYQFLDTIINIVRSFPFIILVVAMIPLTRKLVGTSIGENAAIVPLVIAGAPFIARLVESSLKEVNSGLIEAARSFGASNMQIVFKIMIKEAIPSIISGITLAIVSLLGATAMAGAVGAGGLGAIALTYGYQSFNDTIMYGIVIILIIMVQILQTTGNVLYRKLR